MRAWQRTGQRDTGQSRAEKRDTHGEVTWSKEDTLDAVAMGMGVGRQQKTEKNGRGFIYVREKLCTSTLGQSICAESRGNKKENHNVIRWPQEIIVSKYEK